MSVINTNVMSLNAQRNLATNSTSLATSIQRLSSGLRINSAKDDAAGLAISERFTTQIRGMNQAARNANDGISLSQTAEGALSEVSNNLQRIRELAVQSRNATNSTDDRAALQKEVSQLKSEIDRVADTTTFNGTKLLDGSFTAKDFQVGANQGETITISSIADTNIAALGTWTDTAAVAQTGFAALDVSTTAGADNAILAMDGALKAVNGSRADLGAVQNRFASVVSNLSTSTENLTASRSRIRDTDYAKETAELSRTQILSQAGTAMLAQANQATQGVLSLLR